VVYRLFVGVLFVMLSCFNFTTASNSFKIYAKGKFRIRISRWQKRIGFDVDQ